MKYVVLVLALAGMVGFVNQASGQQPDSFRIAFGQLPKDLDAKYTGFSRNERYLITSNGAELYLRDAKTCVELHRIGGLDMHLDSFSESADGNWLAAGGTNGPILLVSLTDSFSYQLITNPISLWALALSPTGDALYAMSQRGGLARYDRATGVWDKQIEKNAKLQKMVRGLMTTFSDPAAIQMADTNTLVVLSHTGALAEINLQKATIERSWQLAALTTSELYRVGKEIMVYDPIFKQLTLCKENPTEDPLYFQGIVGINQNAQQLAFWVSAPAKDTAYKYSADLTAVILNNDGTIAFNKTYPNRSQPTRLYTLLNARLALENSYREDLELFYLESGTRLRSIAPELPLESIHWSSNIAWETNGKFSYSGYTHFINGKRKNEVIDYGYDFLGARAPVTAYRGPEILRNAPADSLKIGYNRLGPTQVFLQMPHTVEQVGGGVKRHPKQVDALEFILSDREFGDFDFTIDVPGFTSSHKMDLMILDAGTYLVRGPEELLWLQAHDEGLLLMHREKLHDFFWLSNSRGKINTPLYFQNNNYHIYKALADAPWVRALTASDTATAPLRVIGVYYIVPLSNGHELILDRNNVYVTGTGQQYPLGFELSNVAFAGMDQQTDSLYILGKYRLPGDIWHLGSLVLHLPSGARRIIALDYPFNNLELNGLDLEANHMQPFPALPFGFMAVDDQRRFVIGDLRQPQPIAFAKPWGHDFIVYTPDGYFYTSKEAAQSFYYTNGQAVYPFENFDLKFNRPDIVLGRMGVASTELLHAYHAAYLKRLAKMGFREQDLSGALNLPVVQAHTQNLPLETDQPTLAIPVVAYDEKLLLDRLNVYVNDVPLYGLLGRPLRELHLQRYADTLLVQLSKGRNKVQISATNSGGVESLKETFEVIYTPPAPVKPTLWVVSIGVSQYKDSQYNLTYAAKDASDIAAYFTANASSFGAVKTLVLTDANATAEGILAARKFLEQAGVDDQVILFVAGHGMVDGELNYYYGAHATNFLNPAEGGLAYEQLEGLLDGIPCRKKLLLMDTCHSGEADEDDMKLASAAPTQVADGSLSFRGVKPKSAATTAQATQSNLGLQNSFELMNELFADLRRGSGAHVISSAGGGEFALEGEDWNNGVFTYALLSGLKSGAADANGSGKITVSELRDYVSSQVETLTQGTQRPTARRENLEFDFIVK